MDLFDAARAGDTAAIRQLLAAGAAIEACDDERRTPLFEAAARGHHLAVRVLLEAGARVEITDRDWETPLHVAAARGHLAVVDALLEAAPDAKSRSNWLHEAHRAAVGSGQVELARFLVEAGADVNRGTDDPVLPGRTPLMEAAYGGHLGAIRFLLEAGAQVNRSDQGGTTPLHWAVIGGHPQVVRLLLESGAAVEPRARESIPPRGTPVMRAATDGHREIVRILLDVGADVTAADGEGKTALMRAAAEGHLGVLDWLIRAGADLDHQDAEGRTALMEAVGWGRTAAVRALLGAGADPHRRERHGSLPLALAIERGHRAIVRLLRSAPGAGPAVREQEFHASVRQGDPAAVRNSIALGLDANARDWRGQTLLMLAAAGGHLEVLDALLESGADPRARDDLGGTAMVRAAGGGHTRVVERLLAAGVRPDDRSGSGVPGYSHRGALGKWEFPVIPGSEREAWTPLIRAAGAGHLRVVQALLRAGADVNSADTAGNTPLFHALWGTHLDVARSLLESGAVVNERVRDFLPALDFEEAARQPAFREACRRVARLMHSDPETVPEIPGTFSFRLPLPARLRGPGWPDWKQRVRRMQHSAAAACRRHRATLVYSTYRDGDERLALLPTRDPYAAVAAFGTRAGNYELDTHAIIAWRRRLEAEQPFEMTGCGSAWLEIRFATPVTDPESLAAQFDDFRPDVVGEIVDDTEGLIQMLREGRLYLWWD